MLYFLLRIAVFLEWIFMGACQKDFSGPSSKGLAENPQ
jgi:hypothetical protein